MVKKFDAVVGDILQNPQFAKLKQENHHGTTRFDHSVRVAKIMFWTTFHNKNYTRAALMHDFFFGKSTINHPHEAAENAKRITEINDCQENIILAHMFPITTTPVLYFGGWVLIVIDKLVATYELGRFKRSLDGEGKGYFRGKS
ncbi:MAG: hypothetical protein LBM97_00865 [Candidatus Nomurabacteria bacterium]|jgi:uncharacterized protein|nr:hypothetical protein [Candidatus Nomurabacteria bacterium]